MEQQPKYPSASDLVLLFWPVGSHALKLRKDTINHASKTSTQRAWQKACMREKLDSLCSGKFTEHEDDLLSGSRDRSVGWRSSARRGGGLKPLPSLDAQANRLLRLGTSQRFTGVS